MNIDLIENRNLVIVDTLDEFSEKVEDIDFNIEDIAVLVLEVNDVYYWYNVESVWGKMGFTWDYLSNNKGYGHFSASTLPFTIIPSLPDGERITAFNDGMFNSIASDIIIVNKSNWENLSRLGSFPRSNKYFTMDLQGAPLIGNWEVCTTSQGSGEGPYFYFKNTDFSGLNTFAMGGVEIPAPYIVVDDENKGLNLPYPSTSKAGTFYYTGNDYFKLEYFIREDHITSSDFIIGNIKMKSDNLKFWISLNDSYFLGKGDYWFGYKQIVTDESRAWPNDQTTGIELVLDTAYLSEDTTLELKDHILRDSNYLPYIKSFNIQGNHLKIDSVGINCLVDSNHNWGWESNIDYLDILNTPQDPNLEFHFYRHAFLAPLYKCPYIIDLAKTPKVNIFLGVTGVSNLQATDDIKYISSSINGIYVADYLPTIINSSNNYIGDICIDNKLNIFVKENTNWEYCPLLKGSFKCNKLTIRGQFLVAKNTDIYCQNLEITDVDYYRGCFNFEDPTTPSIHINIVDGSKVINSRGLPFYTMDNRSFNIFDFTELYSREYLKLNVLLFETPIPRTDIYGNCNGYILKYPFIFINSALLQNEEGIKIMLRLDGNTPMILFYKCNIYFDSYYNTDDTIDSFINVFMNYILDNIEPVPEGMEGKYEIRMKSRMANAIGYLATNKITNILHYTLKIT